MSRTRRRTSLLLAPLLAGLLSLGAADAPAPKPDSDAAPTLNGFAVPGSGPARAHIRAGGPERDRIQSVDAPELVPPPEATWAPPPVGAIGVEVADEAHAYPVHLMEYHQVVNDTIGGTPVVVSYDPLTGIAAAYRRVVDGRTLEFGVSGLLYREQFLMYDRETESLWAQYEGVAVAGPLAGKRLDRIPSRQEPVGAWVHRYPQTRILARPQPKKIDYRYSPYETYWISEAVPDVLALRATDGRYHPKELVLGVEVDGKQRAYLGSILTAEGGRIVDEFEGHTIRVQYDSNIGLFMYEAPDDVQVTDAYWFAWKSLHPDTGIWHDRPSDAKAAEPKTVPNAGSDTERDTESDTGKETK